MFYFYRNIFFLCVFICSICLKTAVWKTSSWIDSTASSPQISPTCWRVSNPPSPAEVSQPLAATISVGRESSAGFLNVPVSSTGYIHSRVEEEFLWGCKQLGAYSPIVLLNTLLFFCCKYFGFTTVEQHRQLSFAHVMRCTKTNPDNSKTTFLRFYPPIPINEAESGTFHTSNNPLGSVMFTKTETRL